MAIHYRKGNLLDVKSGIILHGCNAQGVMGSGVALSIRNKYPEVYNDYKPDNGYKSRMYLYLGGTIKTWVDEDLLVISAITQQYYGNDGKRYVNYVALVKVFQEAVDTSLDYNYSLNFPKIGAGLGGGDWNIIEQLINDCDPEDKVEKICWEL
jgi:O-acetyl-ADP-ribose deacetylase (regulator of RNase III)